MRLKGFCGGSYTSQSQNQDAEITMNFYQERAESPYAENQFALYPTPGFSSFLMAGQITKTGYRALKVAGSRVFCVVADGLYEIFQNQTATLRGTVAPDANMATISYNGPAGNQLFITSGTNGYNYALGTNTLSTVLTGDATQGAFANGQFLAFNIATGHVRFSAINDGSSWNALDFFARSLRPDPWQAMVVGPDFKIWLIGTESSEIWAYFGGLTNPWQPLVGAVIPYGTIAPWTVHTADDQIRWLSQTSLGAGIFVRASGYYPDRISTHATAFAWSGYALTSVITDAECIAYQDQDHPFTVVNFNSARSSWCFDAATNQWHQRGKWNALQARYDVWSPRVHAYAWGTHLVGDRNNSILSTMDVRTTSEADGTIIRRVRQAPGLVNENNFVQYRKFEVLLESGLGTQTGQGSAPQVMMQYSDNSAHTWSNERLAKAGAAGQYRQRVYWLGCGAGRQRVFRISVTDPIPWRLIDGFLTIGNQQRAA